ncbi:hypothetical protein ALC53_02813, partial [Atta colombica]
IDEVVAKEEGRSEHGAAVPRYNNRAPHTARHKQVRLRFRRTRMTGISMFRINLPGGPILWERNGLIFAVGPWTCSGPSGSLRAPKKGAQDPAAK